MEFWSSMGVTLLHWLRRKEVEISIATVLRLARACHRHPEVCADAKHGFKSSTNLNKMKNKKADGLSAPPPP
jgi:hypothetical protein